MSNIDFTQVITAEAKAATGRAALLAELAAIRWAHETGGITLGDGTELPTDERTVAKLTAAVTSLQDGMVSAPVAWKFANGWQDLAQAQVEACAAAVARHVQACFNAERAVCDQIAALSDLSGFDVVAAFEAAFAVPEGA